MFIYIFWFKQLIWLSFFLGNTYSQQNGICAFVLKLYSISFKITYPKLFCPVISFPQKEPCSRFPSAIYYRNTIFVFTYIRAICILAWFVDIQYHAHFVFISPNSSFSNCVRTFKMSDKNKFIINMISRALYF